MGFSNSSVGKESTCNAGDPGLILGLGRSAGEGIGYPLQYSWAPCGSVGKESTCNMGGLGSIPGLGRSTGGGHGNPLQYSCLENSHGRRDRKELDMTEQISTAQPHNLESYVLL